MCCFAVGNEQEFGFDQSREFIGLGNTQPEAIPLCRSCTDIPELGKVLRCIEKLGSALPESIRALPDHSICIAVRLYKAKQNVRVNQTG